MPYADRKIHLVGLADVPHEVGAINRLEVVRHAQALQRLPGLLLPVCGFLSVEGGAWVMVPSVTAGEMQTDREGRDSRW